jgi:hypothetical protein
MHGSPALPDLGDGVDGATPRPMKMSLSSASLCDGRRLIGRPSCFGGLADWWDG